jgi:hypothetical protein
MALDPATFDAGLQQHYTTRVTKDLCERDNPLYGMVRKNSKVGGNGMKTPVMHRNPTGGSSTYANADANAVEGGYAAFLQTHRDHFHVVNISHKVMKLSSYKEAFFEATKEINRGLSQATNALSRKLFGDIGGSFARLSNSSFATTVMTLVEPQAAYHFEKNEVLVLSPNKNGTSVRSGTLTIASVNRSTGAITLTGNISAGVAAVAQNDYIFKQGDAALGWTGLESFNPISAADLTTLHTVVQTDDPTRLGGYRLDATAMNIEEALIELAAQLSFEGARPDIAFVNPIRFKDLNLSASSGRLGKREVKSTTGFVGYQAFTLMGPKGEISILQDTNCPAYALRMGQLDTLELKSADDAPHIVKTDGLMMRFSETSMNLKVRIAAYGDLTNEAPGYWGVAQLAPIAA